MKQCPKCGAYTYQEEEKNYMGKVVAVVVKCPDCEWEMRIY